MRRNLECAPSSTLDPIAKRPPRITGDRKEGHSCATAELHLRSRPREIAQAFGEVLGSETCSVDVLIRKYCSCCRTRRPRKENSTVRCHKSAKFPLVIPSSSVASRAAAASKVSSASNPPPSVAHQVRPPSSYWKRRTNRFVASMTSNRAARRGTGWARSSFGEFGMPRVRLPGGSSDRNS